ncbi:MAG: hypothetical protein KatS3mg096_355 [Candidatus Parcubacteria bacterium]|nr:MAG: hypothetical protein KatS3mg096_355 [Candidatus Parcubacteria bacterium]
MKLHNFYFLLITSFFVAILFSSYFIIFQPSYAWINPSQNPPLGGGVLQTDTSGLKIVTTTQITSGNFTVNTGNVGIGTANPNSKLQIDDQSASHYIGRYDPTCCGSSQIPANQFRGFTVFWNTDLAMFGLRDYGGDRKDVVINNEQGGDNIRFQIAGSDVMFIRGSDGNVGIGTTAPGATARSFRTN